MRKVFISYARENKPDIDQLVEQLSILGCQTWIDSSLHGGQNWWDEVMRRIADCEAFIAIISRGALNSVACQREFDWAEDLSKPVLPVAVEPPPTALPRRYSKRQIVDYSDPGHRDRAALMLAGGLAALPAAPSLPEPLPEPPAAPLSYLTDLIDLVSQPKFLDHEQQRQILVQLEPALRSLDPEERRGGRDTLERFNSRGDLFADVDRAIAQLRRISDQPAVATPAIAKSESGLDVARDTPLQEEQPLLGSPEQTGDKSASELPLSGHLAPEGRSPSRFVQAGYPEPSQVDGALPKGAYTPWIKRVGAGIIDVIPLVVVLGIGYGITGTIFTGPDTAVIWVAWLLALAYASWNYGYREGSTGSSIGKSVLKFKVVSEWNGQPIGFWRSIARQLAHIVDLIICYIGFLFPLWDAKGQTLADKIMLTVCLPITCPPARAP